MSPPKSKLNKITFFLDNHLRKKEKDYMIFALSDNFPLHHEVCNLSFLNFVNEISSAEIVDCLKLIGRLDVAKKVEEFTKTGKL